MLSNLLKQFGMGFFKYKWQVVVAIGVGFGWMLLINALSFKFLDYSTIIAAYLVGLGFGLVIYFLRKKEPWLQKLK